MESVQGSEVTTGTSAVVRVWFVLKISQMSQLSRWSDQEANLCVSEGEATAGAGFQRVQGVPENCWRDHMICVLIRISDYICGFVCMCNDLCQHLEYCNPWRIVCWDANGFEGRLGELRCWRDPPGTNGHVYTFTHTGRQWEMGAQWCFWCCSCLCQWWRFSSALMSVASCVCHVLYICAYVPTGNTCPASLLTGHEAWGCCSRFVSIKLTGLITAKLDISCSAVMQSVG